MSIDQSVLDKFEAVVESQRKRIMDMKARTILLITPSWTS